MTGVTDDARSLGHHYRMNRIDTTHGNRSLTERRLSTEQQIAFYLTQARLARAGITQRDEPFYLRQVEYFRAELDATVSQTDTVITVTVSGGGNEGSVSRRLDSRWNGLVRFVNGIFRAGSRLQ